MATVCDMPASGWSIWAVRGWDEGGQEECPEKRE